MMTLLSALALPCSTIKGKSEVVAYPTTESEQKQLNKYSLSAYFFKREASLYSESGGIVDESNTNEIAFLFYSPKMIDIKNL